MNDLDAFINCPFDGEYKPMFQAIVFTIVRCGFRARCALEADNAADSRIEKICRIIAECRFGVHDISKTEASGDPPLPRFNMPLELGLFLGARRYGTGQQKKKSCIIFDRERYRYQRYISDISGQDIHAHGGDVTTLIVELAAWLRTQPQGSRIPGGQAIAADYVEFERLLPLICAARELQVDELLFGDFNAIATEYVAARAATR
ncbi:hypothetical protein [Methylopila sp. M107]|uniref:hypothetical protein n=1 Tax=Methylopila sp. M107 TaxID=1101190 RepID=UPI00037B5C96|nr:hypothetical protein [Methylopila sp. M107]